jgi:predicted dehydrogenase
MQSIPRREFLGRSSRKLFGLSAAALAADAALARRNPVRAVPASEKVVLASVGMGGRGQNLAQGFAARPDCTIAYVCDPDERRSREFLARFQPAAGDKAPVAVQDYRRALDDKSVNAVFSGTPDHWHALVTIHACQAEKDVYVEKPASHNIWEGRKMVEAARKYKRVVQVGTQNRSAPYCQKAVEYIRSGGIGDIRLCKVFNLKSGGPFKLQSDQKCPDGVDYDRWLGPAPARPFNPSHFHGGWYYFWAYCGGDMGNDGSHQLDIARWLCGKDYPKAVHASGGKLVYPDDREVPDTQVATFEFDGLVMTFENTNWPPYMKKISQAVRDGDVFPYWPQTATRIELYGTKHLMLFGRHGGGWQVFTDDGQVVEQMSGRFPDVEHKENFIACVRNRQHPSADIEEGHRSAILSHLGNISLRLGGRKLYFDAKTESFTGGSDVDLKEANALLKREYRKPYVVPEVV